MLKKSIVEHRCLLIGYSALILLPTLSILLTLLQPQLHQQLMQVALDSGVNVSSGVGVESVDIGGTAVLLADGERVSAELVIGADGLHVGDASF